MQDKKVSKKYLDDRGVILLIAVMIMATLLTAALGTGTLVINIVNQSASIDYSISAFYAAQAGIEKNLYRIRKDNYIPPVKLYGAIPEISDPNIGDILTLDDSVTLQAHYDLTAINGKDEIIFDIKANQEYAVDLYPLVGMGSSVFPKQLTLSGRGNSQDEVIIQMTAISWSGGVLNVPNAAIQTIPIGDEAITPVIPINLVSPASIHKVKIKAFGGDLENLHLTAENNTDGDVAIPGIYVLTSTGSYPYGGARQATQVLTVEMPILEPAYGLYNYVIFSEEAIEKYIPPPS